MRSTRSGKISSAIERSKSLKKASRRESKAKCHGEEFRPGREGCFAHHIGSRRNRLRRKTKHNAYQVRQDAEHQHEYEDLPTNDPGIVQRTCVECGHAMDVEVM